MWIERALGPVAEYVCRIDMRDEMDFSIFRPLPGERLAGIRKSEPRKVRQAKKAKRALQNKSRRANRR